MAVGMPPKFETEMRAAQLGALESKVPAGFKIRIVIDIETQKGKPKVERLRGLIIVDERDLKAVSYCGTRGQWEPNWQLSDCYSNVADAVRMAGWWADQLELLAMRRAQATVRLAKPRIPIADVPEDEQIKEPTRVNVLLTLNQSRTLHACSLALRVMNVGLNNGKAIDSHADTIRYLLDEIERSKRSR